MFLLKLCMYLYNLMSKNFFVKLLVSLAMMPLQPRSILFLLLMRPSPVIIYCVGRLPKTKSGCENILTIMSSTTRFPEAIPLRNIKARTVSNALVNFFTLFGLAKEVQSDQGSNFMSGIFQQVTRELGVRQIKSSAYHPERQGALERFHASLKTMIRAYVEQHEKDWDVGLPLLMFAARESVQESLGFSPFDLVFGHHVRGPLKLLKEQWLNDDDEAVKVNLLDYVSRFRTRLYEAGEIAKKNLENSQQKMKMYYSRNAEAREYKPGDKVLVLLPLRVDPLQAKYHGLYKVFKKVMT